MTSLKSDTQQLSRSGSYRSIAQHESKCGWSIKLLEAAQDRWRAVNGPHLVALVRAGARFDKGVMIERPDEAQEVAA